MGSRDRQDDVTLRLADLYRQDDVTLRLLFSLISEDKWLLTGLSRRNLDIFPVLPDLGGVEASVLR